MNILVDPGHMPFDISVTGDLSWPLGDTVEPLFEDKLSTSIFGAPVYGLDLMSQREEVAILISSALARQTSLAAPTTPDADTDGGDNSSETCSDAVLADPEASALRQLLSLGGAPLMAFGLDAPRIGGSDVFEEQHELLSGHGMIVSGGVAPMAVGDSMVVDGTDSLDGDDWEATPVARRRDDDEVEVDSEVEEPPPTKAGRKRALAIDDADVPSPKRQKVKPLTAAEELQLLIASQTPAVNKSPKGKKGKASPKRAAAKGGRRNKSTTSSAVAADVFRIQQIITIVKEDDEEEEVEVD